MEKFTWRSIAWGATFVGLGIITTQVGIGLLKWVAQSAINTMATTATK